MIFINRNDLPEANTTCKICGHKYRLCNRCLKLRSMGLESWRALCDCIECYQVYVVLSKETEDITKEEYEQIKSIELPIGQEYTDEIKARFKELEEHFKTDNKSQTDIHPEKFFVEQTSQVEQSGQEEKKTAPFKKYEYGYNKKKQNRIPYKNR